MWYRVGPREWGLADMAPPLASCAFWNLSSLRNASQRHCEAPTRHCGQGAHEGGCWVTHQGSLYMRTQTSGQCLEGATSSLPQPPAIFPIFRRGN